MEAGETLRRKRKTMGKGYGDRRLLGSAIDNQSSAVAPQPYPEKMMRMNEMSYRLNTG